MGETISLTFSMPNSQKHFKMTGKIGGSAHGGVGVQFNTKLTQYQEEIIKISVDPKNDGPVKSR